MVYDLLREEDRAGPDVVMPDGRDGAETSGLIRHFQGPDGYKSSRVAGGNRTLRY